MTLPPEARRQRLHQLGPWYLVGGVALVAVGVELARRHVLNKFEVIYFCVLIPSIIIHEVTHGVVAYWCGDDTAKEAGRLSLNPLRHVDPLGTVLLPLILVLTNNGAFGWAKPVPVSVNRLRHPRNQAVLVSLAGPAVNILLAAIGGVALYLATDHGTSLLAGAQATGVVTLPLGDEILYLFGIANVVLAIFNLIPVPPLDGSAVIERLLPASLLPGYYRVRMYSMFIVLALVIFDQNLLGSLFDRVANDWQRLWLPALG